VGGDKSEGSGAPGGVVQCHGEFHSSTTIVINCHNAKIQVVMDIMAGKPVVQVLRWGD
jgi:hypothetical protein